MIVVGAILNLLFLFLFLLMLLPDDTDAESEEAAERNEDLHAVQEETKEAYSGDFESWAVYWYLCGTDLSKMPRLIAAFDAL